MQHIINLLLFLVNVCLTFILDDLALLCDKFICIIFRQQIPLRAREAFSS